MRTEGTEAVLLIHALLQFQVFGIGIAVTSVLTLLTPLAAKAGVGALIAVRLIEGIFEVKN